MQGMLKVQASASSDTLTPLRGLLARGGSTLLSPTFFLPHASEFLGFWQGEVSQEVGLEQALSEAGVGSPGSAHNLVPGSCCSTSS